MLKAMIFIEFNKNQNEQDAILKSTHRVFMTHHSFWFYKVSPELNLITLF